MLGHLTLVSSCKHLNTTWAPRIAQGESQASVGKQLRAMVQILATDATWTHLCRLQFCSGSRTSLLAQIVGNDCYQAKTDTQSSEMMERSSHWYPASTQQWEKLLHFPNQHISSSPLLSVWVLETFRQKCSSTPSGMGMQTNKLYHFMHPYLQSKRVLACFLRHAFDFMLCNTRRFLPPSLQNQNKKRHNKLIIKILFSQT